MKKLPWLEYTGQTSSEILACKSTYRIDSLLCAFEEGIEAKVGIVGGGSSTGEERLVLAVMALDREVNNGGYDQFFVNSSRRFVPIIVDSLQRIECAATAAVTERAIAALRLSVPSPDAVSAIMQSEDPRRDEMLTACDNDFYKLHEIERNLFRFIETHQDQIQLIKGTRPVRLCATPRVSNATTLFAHLLVSKSTDISLDGIHRAAQELARQNEIPATDAEIEGVAVLYAFGRALRARDLTACDLLAPRAFELMREDTLHCVLHRDWVKQLMQAGRGEAADASALTYLEYLRTCDRATLTT